MDKVIISAAITGAVHTPSMWASSNGRPASVATRL